MPPYLLRALGLILAIFLFHTSDAVADDSRSMVDLLQQRLVEHESIIATDAQNIESLLVLAQTHERLGHWSRALDYYRQIRQIDTSHAPARRGCERLEKILRPRLSAQWSYFVDEEYAPEWKAKDYRREETRYQLGAEKQFSKDGLFLLEWRKGSVKQISEFYQDTDFSIKYNGPTLKAGLPLGSRFTLLGKLEYSRYETDEDAGFYALKSEKDLLTGTASLTYRGAGYWLASRLFRYRDFNLIYEELTAANAPGEASYRTELKVVAQTVYALEAGVEAGGGWSVSGGVLYEDSQTLDPDQFRLRTRLFYSTGLVKNLQFFGQGDYYFKEEKTLLGGGASYLFTLFKRIDTGLSYQLLYTDPENSWLNQGSLNIKWRFMPGIAWTLVAHAGKEIGDDEDQFYVLNSGLEVRF